MDFNDKKSGLKLDNSDPYSLKFKTFDDATKYSESICNKSNDCIGFWPAFFQKEALYMAGYFNNEIKNKIDYAVYVNDRDQNNPQINYKKYPYSTIDNTKNDSPIGIKTIREIDPFDKKSEKRDVSLTTCKKMCDDDKNCYGIEMNTPGLGNSCTTLSKEILDPTKIQEGMGDKNKFEVFFKNSVSTDENKNSVSTEKPNNYTEKKLDHMIDMKNSYINNDEKSFPSNYIDKDKIKNIKTYDDLLNYNKLMCDKNKDCFGFLSKKITQDELNKMKPEDFQKIAESSSNFIFFNDKIKASSNIYVNDRNENNPNINYKKNPNSTLKKIEYSIIDTIPETKRIYNKDDPKNPIIEKNDISLDTCKKKCNDNKDCYGIGDFFNFEKVCITYKKDALKPENIIPNKEEIDFISNAINSNFSIYYKDIPNKNTLSNIGVDITGSRPSQSGSSWSNSVSQKTKNLYSKEDCEVGTLCSTQNGFGIYNNDCDCIVNTEEENNGITSYLENNEECNLQCDTNNSNNSNNLNKNFNKILSELDEKNKIKCYPNDTNFSKICSDQSPTYGVKSINSCDKDTSSVVCDPNYLNGKYTGTSIITPCLNKTDDFDVWCKYYNNKPVPEGYNINSIGVKNLLVGKEGECYLNNNIPDNSKARGVCDYNYIDNITKISSSNLKDNNFTDCSSINSNFNILCDNLSKRSIASEIMGYDCNPGFARAKCINRNDAFIKNNQTNNLSNDTLTNNIFDENKNASRNFCQTKCKKN